MRALLHLCICMSPVGDAMRNRCRKFPALTSCTAINWFFNWPAQALISVTQRFLSDVEMEDKDGDGGMTIRNACADHMAYVHESVGHAAESYRGLERREVYTTPKSYLELILLYKKLLREKEEHVDAMRNDWHVYLTRDGRMSMAGMKPDDVPLVARAIHAVCTSQS